MFSLATVTKSDKYNKVPPWACETFLISYITEWIITIKNDCFPSVNPKDQATPLVGPIKRLRCFRMWKIYRKKLRTRTI